MKRFKILLYSIFIIIILFLLIYFWNNLRKYNLSLNEFEKVAVSGKIKSIKDLTRGSFYLTLENNSKIPALNIGWEVDKYGISIGDSVFKAENSKIIKFYKLKNGAYLPNFEFKISTY